eukprot:1886099-Lingulodinium_polyedra.AAC.1
MAGVWDMPGGPEPQQDAISNVGVAGRQLLGRHGRLHERPGVRWHHQSPLDEPRPLLFNGPEEVRIE